MIHTAEEVREMATNVRDCAWPADVKDYMALIEPMLRAYADRIEHAQKGVTDEVVDIALAIFPAQGRVAPYRGTMRNALLAVWPVADERIKADEGARYFAADPANGDFDTFGTLADEHHCECAYTCKFCRDEQEKQA